MKTGFSAYVNYAILGMILWLLFTTVHAAQRIVTIDGSLTEIVYALGAGHLLVGRDVTSFHPPQAIKLPSVGYMRSLTAEGVLSLNPDLVLVTQDARPQKILQQLKQTGVHVEIINNDYSLEGVINKITEVARLLNRQAAGETLAKKVKTNFIKAQNHLKNLLANYGDIKALFVMSVRGNSILVAGNQTRADTMLNLAGLHNPAKSYFNQYKPISPEALVKFNPHFIIMMQHSITASGGKKNILDSVAIKLTEAGKNKQIVVTSDSFLTFGPRLGLAMHELSDRLDSHLKNK